MKDLRFDVCEEEGSVLFTLFTRRAFFLNELSFGSRSEAGESLCLLRSCKLLIF